MADLKVCDVCASKAEVTLNVSAAEYRLLKLSEDDLLLLPVGEDVLSEELTTGRLGNGNRIMLPNKVLKKHGMESLSKKLKSMIFEVEGSRYLLCKLKEKKPGVPVFREE
jgi:hypothetical protein